MVRRARSRIRTVTLALPAKFAQRSKLIAPNRMGARLAILHSADMQRGGVEIDLLPSHVADLRGP